MKKRKNLNEIPILEIILILGEREREIVLIVAGPYFRPPHLCHSSTNPPEMV